jgi:DNA polymerase V
MGRSHLQHPHHLIAGQPEPFTQSAPDTVAAIPFIPPPSGNEENRGSGFIAIVDCNSFYCSCERLFRPRLDKKPVVVLSNNDGCIIARSDEAKQMGVKMGEPYFKMKALIEQQGIHTFSSNYHLYGDLSWRVMETMRTLAGSGNVEVYSVDEAFVNLGTTPREQLWETALQIRETVEQWTGIRVSVGVAPTKVLAKAANRLAKKNKEASQCVMVLDDTEKISDALCRTPVGEVWGIGRRYAEKLMEHHAVFTALDLRQKNEEWAKKNLGGVVGLRLLRELKGMPSCEMKDPFTEKKIIATTRMFGRPVNNRTDIREAVATYTARAAEKLRRQHSAASVISVFLVPRQPFTDGPYRHGPGVSAYMTLPTASSATNLLTKLAVTIAEALFEEGKTYKKAGVVLSGIFPDGCIQPGLFEPLPDSRSHRLMNTLDNVNFAMRNDVLHFASAGTSHRWKMRQELRSPRYTTRWDEMCTVK